MTVYCFKSHSLLLLFSKNIKKNIYLGRKWKNPLIFPNVIDKISHLDVRWVNECGVLVDFGKVEHSFTLEFIHYITQADVNSYNTKLGTIDRKSYPDFLSGSQSENMQVKMQDKVLKS